MQPTREAERAQASRFDRWFLAPIGAQHQFSYGQIAPQYDYADSQNPAVNDSELRKLEREMSRVQGATGPVAEPLPGGTPETVNPIDNRFAPKPGSVLGEAVLPAGGALSLLTKDDPGALDFVEAGADMLPALGPLAAAFGTMRRFPGPLPEARVDVAKEPKVGGLGSFDWPVRATEGRPGEVSSTRFPTAKKAPEDPMTHNLTVDFEHWLSDPKVLAAAEEKLSQYPIVREGSSDPIGEALDTMQGNLEYVYDSYPWRDRARKWYEGGNRISTDRADRLDLPIHATAGVYAGLSPQKDWFQNVSLGDRVLDMYYNQRGVQATPDMRDFALRTPTAAPRAVRSDANRFSRIFESELGDLEDPIDRAVWMRAFDEAHRSPFYRVVSPEGELQQLARNAGGELSRRGWQSTSEIAKVIRMLDDPSLENVSRNLGEAHKVRHFHPNLSHPFSPRGEGTVDTHQVALGVLSPIGGDDYRVLHALGSGAPSTIGGVPNPSYEPFMSKFPGSAITGYQGSYPLHLEAMQRASRNFDIFPREMQSGGWEGIRSLFTNKSANARDAADALWREYRMGRMSLDQVRETIHQLSGGYTPPAWAE